MKIIINYDFIEKVKNAKQPLTAFKVIRCNRNKIFFDAPFFLMFNMIYFHDFSKSLLYALFINTPAMMLPRILAALITKIDTDKVKAYTILINLISLFQDLNVKTNYELLLESYMYDKKYKLCLDENKMPYILESKYIMVPSYDYKGDITETSILQEHVIGDKDYVLTLGRSHHDFKLAFSGV